MNAIPLLPDFLEWYLVISFVSIALWAFICSSSGRPTERSPGEAGHVPNPNESGAANPHESVGAGQVPALRRHVRRRQSRARLKRMSQQTKQENDARIRLHRAGVLVMAGKSARRVNVERLLNEEKGLSHGSSRTFD